MILKNLKIKKIAHPQYWKMAATQDGGQIGFRQSAGQNKGLKRQAVWDKTIYIIIRTIVYQSRPY